MRDLRGYVYYQRLDRLRLSEPARAARLAGSALPLVDPLLVPGLLGVLGSSLRRMSLLRAAHRTLTEALAIARRQGNRWALADLRQRLAHVHGDRGEYRRALELAVEAANLHLIRGDRAGAGRALVDQGLWHYHLEEYRESIAANFAALRELPAAEVNHRFAAFLGLAYDHQALDDLAEARQWAAAAEQTTAGVGDAMVASLRWLRARLAMDQGDFAEAEEQYRRAVDHYLERDQPLDAATATVELARAQFLGGRVAAAVATARSMMRYIGPLEPSRLATGAVIDLARTAVAGEALTLERLEEARRRLARARRERRGKQAGRA